MPSSRRQFLAQGSALAAAALGARKGWGAPISLATATAAPRMAFVEGAKASRLNFMLRTGLTGRAYQPAAMAGGLGVIDFDGDGWPDLYCVNGGTMPGLKKADASFWNRLYKNNRDGTFTDVTEKAGVAGTAYGIGVAVGDYNNDGHEDIFVAGVHGNQLFRNNGDGTFTDVTEAAGLRKPAVLGLWAIAAAWIDYDGDGYLDLFISNCCDWTPETDPVCGGITPATRLACHPKMYKPEAMQLFHNNGDGTFTEVTRTAALAEALGKGMGIAVADFAGDGRPGIFVANDNMPCLLFRNTGHGFEEIGVDAGVAYDGSGRNISGMGADFGDIDGDGRFDIVMTAVKNESFGCFLNRGKGVFEDGRAQTQILSLTNPYSGWGCGLVDLDNDGWLDFFVAAGGLEETDPFPNQLFRNIGGKFVSVSKESGIGLGPARAHRGCVFADFDRDGRIDIAVSSMDGPLEMWWNKSAPQNWLQLRLTGSKSNRSAIGALVTLAAGGRTQIRCVNSCVGYASSSDLTVHFGLGAETSAAVKIQWPSGVVQELGVVKCNERIEAKEPVK
jgi:hypothetical protein